MRYIIAIILIAFTLSSCFAADTAATSSKEISISYYSITTTATQPLAPATPITFTLIDNNTAIPTPATTWQYRKLGDSVWKAAGKDSKTATISFTDADAAAQYEVQAIKDGIPVTILMSVMKQNLAPLLVVATVPVTKGSADDAVKSRMGANVVVDTAANVSAAGYNFANTSKIVIGPSARSTVGLGTALLNVAKPILVVGINIVATELNVTVQTNGNENDSTIKVSTSGATHALANGKTADEYTIYTNGKLVERSNRIARGAVGIAQCRYAQNDRFTIIAMPAGGELTTGTAVAKRAFLGFFKSDFWSADAQGFFDAAYNWLDN